MIIAYNIIICTNLAKIFILNVLYWVNRKIEKSIINNYIYSFLFFTTKKPHLFVVFYYFFLLFYCAGLTLYHVSPDIVSCIASYPSATKFATGFSVWLFDGL